jgi:hypothetical protein
VSEYALIVGWTIFLGGWRGVFVKMPSHKTLGRFFTYRTKGKGVSLSRFKRSFKHCKRRAGENPIRMSGSHLCIPRNKAACTRYFQNIIIMFCLSISTFTYLERFLNSQDWSAYFAAVK